MSYVFPTVASLERNALTNCNKGTEKTHLLRLEKNFQDKVVDALKEGMIVKGEVNYAGLSQRVVDMTKDVKESYQRLLAPAGGGD